MDIHILTTFLNILEGIYEIKTKSTSLVLSISFTQHKGIFPQPKMAVLHHVIDDVTPTSRLFLSFQITWACILKHMAI